jgi:hypothetical protein
VERLEECVTAGQQMHCLGGKPSEQGKEKMKQLAVDRNKHKAKVDQFDLQLSYVKHKTVKC